MTADEFKREMQGLIDKYGSETEDGDTVGEPECFHQDADDLICRALNELGYSEGVALFQQQTKWYS